MPKDTRIHLEQITKIQKMLRELPCKENVKTRDEAVGILGKDFRMVAEKGYSPQEISALLKQIGISIPVSHLREPMRLKERKKSAVSQEEKAENKIVTHIKKNTKNDDFYVPDTPLEEL